MKIREFINKRPALGWGFAAFVTLVAIFFAVRNMKGGETNQLTEEVTIRCAETGKEWKMSRGAMERQLMLRPYPVNPEEGITNPDTGKPTGFPVGDWGATVKRINDQRSYLAEKNKDLKPTPPPKTKK